jgi:hypothetical protein
MEDRYAYNAITTLSDGTISIPSLNKLSLFLDSLLRYNNTRKVIIEGVMYERH